MNRITVTNRSCVIVVVDDDLEPIWVSRVFDDQQQAIDFVRSEIIPYIFEYDADLDDQLDDAVPHITMTGSHVYWLTIVGVGMNSSELLDKLEL